jgi:hypothetical protein
VDDKLKRRLKIEISENEKTEKEYCFVPSVSIRAALEIIVNPEKFGVALLPTKGHEQIDKNLTKWKAERELQDYVYQHGLQSYSLKNAITDLDDVLLRLGIIVVDIRKKYI